MSDVEGTPRATKGHQVCVWCKKGHRSTKPRTIGEWTGKVCATCERKMTVEYEAGRGALSSEMQALFKKFDVEDRRMKRMR